VNKYLYRFYPLPSFDELSGEIQNLIKSKSSLDHIFNDDTEYSSLSSADAKLFSLYNLLLNKKLYLADIAKFNDPSESIIDMQREVTQALGLNIADNHFKKYTDGMELVRINIADKFLSNTIGIACFTENMHSPVMWGTTYGNNHNAICVKFEVHSKRLMEILQEEPTPNPEERTIDTTWPNGNLTREYSTWGRIVYESDVNKNNESIAAIFTDYFREEILPKYIASKEDYKKRVGLFHSIIQDRLFRKHIDWQPEREVRYINSGTTGNISISPNTGSSNNILNDLDIAGIIYGANVDLNFHKYFCSLLESSSMLFEKAIIPHARRSMISIPYSLQP
jgi:hypothetical protein